MRWKVFVCVLGSMTFLLAQAPKEDPVRIGPMSAEFQQARSTLKVQGRLSIDPSWHVYSDSVLPDYFIPLSLELADSAQGKRIKREFPGPVIKDFMGEPVSLFHGNLELKSFFYLEPTVKFPVQLRLTYQSCNDEMCLPPHNKILSVEKDGAGTLVVTK